MVKELDPVAQRLAAASDVQPSLVLDWLASRQSRGEMDRRARWCTFGAWLLVTAAAVVGCLVAVKFSREFRKTFADTGFTDFSFYRELDPITVPLTVQVAPAFLAFAAAVCLIGGIMAWGSGRFPGLSWTRSAIDWSEISDGVSRLLAVGCTYPEAFQTASKISRTSANRRWLQSTASRIESGSAGLSTGLPASSDQAVLEMLVEESEAEPSVRWRLANEHFEEVASRRLALLQGTAPVISTLLAGLLIWISISATLGWMWGMIARMLVG